jgi:hypothetical protein
MTARTPPIIERGMLPAGSRSSSEKYRALCHPPYVITTACSANTTPAIEAVADAAADAFGVPPIANAATTSARNAKNFTAVAAC